MRELLISGIPGTGKTTLGNYLEENFGFVHVDLTRLEKDNIESEEHAHLENQIEDMCREDKDFVLTWGFGPGISSHENTLVMILGKGVQMIWLDGNRNAARSSFLKRESSARSPLSASEFDAQVKRIDDNDPISLYHPAIVNTFQEDGTRRQMSKVVDEILRKTTS